MAGDWKDLVGSEPSAKLFELMQGLFCSSGLGQVAGGSKMADSVRSRSKESGQLWSGQGGGVTTAAGGLDPGAVTGGGSSFSTGVAARTGCCIQANGQVKKALSLLELVIKI